MNQNHKFMWAAVLLALLLTVAVSGTLAYLTDATNEVKNIFTPSEVKCQVTEDSFNGTTKTNVAVKNTGDTDAFIRAAIVVTWKSGIDGTVYGAAPTTGDYSLVLDESKWFKKGDFYYYPDIVKVGDSTGSLITSCGLNNTAVVPAGYMLNVEILAQAIQADGEAISETVQSMGTGRYPVEQAWGVNYNETTKTISAN